MAAMGNIEAEAKAAVGFVEHEAAAAAHGFAGVFPHWHHSRHADAAPQTPATQPVNLAPAGADPRRRTMSLATIEDDVKADLTQGLDWLDGFVSRVKAAAPGIIATSEAVGSSTVSALVEAVAGRILPPQLEGVLATMVKDFVDRYAPAQVAAPVASQPPAAPAQ